MRSLESQNDRRRLSEIRVGWVKPTKEGPIQVGFTHPTKAKRRFGYGFKTPHSLQAVAVEVKPMLTSDPVRAARARFGTGLLKVLHLHRKPIIIDGSHTGREPLRPPRQGGHLVNESLPC